MILYRVVMSAAFASIALVAVLTSAPIAQAGFTPPAFAGFCAKFPGECVRRGEVIEAIALNTKRSAQMRSVNAAVNGSIRQVEDRGDVWTLPVNGKGDCEDLALLKRKKLIALGWPSSVLLMTVARDRQGAGHAVLTVVTDKGDYILDNRTGAIRLAGATGYRYYSRQSASNPRVWVDIDRSGKGLPTSSIDRATIPAVNEGLYANAELWHGLANIVVASAADAFHGGIQAYRARVVGLWFVD